MKKVFKYYINKRFTFRRSLTLAPMLLLIAKQSMAADKLCTTQIFILY